MEVEENEPGKGRGSSKRGPKVAAAIAMDVAKGREATLGWEEEGEG